MSRFELPSAFLAAAFIAACGGDPGAPIGDAPVVAPPVATDPAPSDPGSGTPAPGSVRLTVVVEGNGAVRMDPGGVECRGTCTATFAPGAHVTLTPIAAEGWHLAGWHGACAGVASCAVTLDHDASVTSTLSLIDARWDPSVGKQDCLDAWGKKGEKLSPCDTTKDDYVVARKSKRNVALCKSGGLVENLRSGLGDAPVGAKEKQGDGRTPEGVFYVPRLIPESAYYKSLLLSYPTPADAQRGVSQQLITANVRAQIESAHAACVEPPQTTALGGELALTGNGSSADWTHGSIAVDDASMDLIWSALGVGDTIVILP